MDPVWLVLWKSSGRISCHSSEVGIWDGEITLRWDVRASQRIKMKRIKDKKESIDPIEEMIFHLEYISG